MITITHTVNGNTFTHQIESGFDAPVNDEEYRAVRYIAGFYPNITPDERKTIRVVQNGLKVTNATLLKVEEALRVAGWAVLFPIGKQRPPARCKECGAQLIKIGRDPNNMIRAKCFTCQREALLTNGQYYVDLCDEDQE